jgi:hypothetical protein
MRKKDFGFLDKVKREISLTKIPQFNNQTDANVIFSLLDHYFRMNYPAASYGVSKAFLS